MARMLDVSRASFYRRRVSKNRGEPSGESVSWTRLAALILTHHVKSDATYGVPRITVDLRDVGIRLTRKTVANAMNELVLRGLALKRSW